MTDFNSSFQKYEHPVPPGVRLPEIKIDARHYEKLGVSSSVSNYEFLRQLCLKAVKEKGIDKLDNKKEYYERYKEYRRSIESSYCGKLRGSYVKTS